MSDSLKTAILLGSIFIVAGCGAIIAVLCALFAAEGLPNGGLPLFLLGGFCAIVASFALYFAIGALFDHRKNRKPSMEDRQSQSRSFALKALFGSATYAVAAFLGISVQQGSSTISPESAKWFAISLVVVALIATIAGFSRTANSIMDCVVKTTLFTVVCLCAGLMLMCLFIAVESILKIAV